MDLKSSVENLIWPVVQGGRAAELMALQRQFDASQWWAPEQLQQMQFKQLSALADHAYKQVPYYQDRLRKAGFRPGKPIDEDIWGRLPVLTRAEVRELGDKLHAKTYPPLFGHSGIATSGGTTGLPVRVKKTAIDNLMWEAAVLREQIWHEERPEGTYVVIRGMDISKFTQEQISELKSAHGLMSPDVGPPTSMIWHTGKLGRIHINQPTAEHVEFILKTQPTHLIIFPSSLRLILNYFIQHSLRMTSLKSVKALSEKVDDDLRQMCEAVFGCKITHNYTANETGYIAIQCPQSNGFHVQSELVLCEVVDEKHLYCQPGQIGRVLITPLHNYAMPLLRYEVGDEAEVGNLCSCKRGLPVLNQIIGRMGDYVTLKSGARRRLTYNGYKLASIQAIKEYQLVQKNLETIEIRLVTNRDLTPHELANIQTVMDNAFGDEFKIEIIFHEALARTPSGKFRTFINNVEKQ